MNKTLFGLAFLSYNWDTQKKDIFESYIPLLCHALLDNRQDKISRDIIKAELAATYGINISLGAVESLLKRMTSKKLLIKELGEYTVDYVAVSEFTSGNKKENLSVSFDVLVRDLKKFSKENFSVEISSEEIEIGLLNFFKEHDLDLMFANNDGLSILPKTKDIKKVKYIIAKFITHIYTSDPERFIIVSKLAQGYAIASLITYEDLQVYTGNLDNVDVYLDAPIIFNLLGLNGDSNLALSQELVETLNRIGADLKVFEINYEEVVKTIQDAIRRLNEKDYDIFKSSRVLKTALRESISGQELQIILNQLDDILVNNKVSKVTSPTLQQTEWKFQIDEEKLGKSIEELYKTPEIDAIANYKVRQIERDVKAISNIFKIRKRNQAVSIKNSKALFLTNNEIIAFATKKYEQSDWEFKSKIPACLTDVFLSTILWSNYPDKNESLNIKLLISECYNIIELDNRLLQKFYDDITKMHRDNRISVEQFYLLNTSNLTYSLLEKRTLNDIDAYTDKTPAEILQDIQLNINVHLDKEKAKNYRVERNIRKISKFAGRISFYVIALILIMLALLFKVFTPTIKDNLFNIILWPIVGFITIFGLLRWMEIIPTRTKIESKIEDFVFHKLNHLLNKED